MRVSEVLISIDKFCNYIPVVSTGVNLVVLFQQYVYRCCNPETISQNQYFSYIRDRDLTIIDFIPFIGNYYYIQQIHYPPQPLPRAFGPPAVTPRIHPGEGEEQAGQAAATARKTAIKEELKGRKSLGLEPHLLVEVAQAFPGNNFVTLEDMSTPVTEKQLLLWAYCTLGKEKEVCQLMREGVDHNFHYKGQTLLTAACMHGHRDIVQAVHNWGENLTMGDHYGQIPILMACEMGNLWLFQYLEVFSDNDKEDDLGRTALMLACENGRETAVRSLMNVRGYVNVLQKTKEGRDAFTYALSAKQYNLLPILFPDKDLRFDKLAYDVYATPTQESPLQYAVISGNFGACEFLIRRTGVNIAKPNAIGQNVLHTLCSCKFPNGKLFNTILRLPEATLSRLLKQQDEKGKTPLHYLMTHGKNMNAIYALVSKGADIHIADNDGKSPLQIAKDRKFVAVARKIEKKEVPWDIVLEESAEDEPSRIAEVPSRAQLIHFKSLYYPLIPKFQQHAQEIIELYTPQGVESKVDEGS